MNPLVNKNTFKIVVSIVILFILNLDFLKTILNTPSIACTVLYFLGVLLFLYLIFFSDQIRLSALVTTLILYLITQASDLLSNTLFLESNYTQTVTSKTLFLLLISLALFLIQKLKFDFQKSRRLLWKIITISSVFLLFLLTSDAVLKTNYYNINFSLGFLGINLYIFYWIFKHDPSALQSVEFKKTLKITILALILFLIATTILLAHFSNPFYISLIAMCGILIVLLGSILLILNKNKFSEYYGVIKSRKFRIPMALLITGIIIRTMVAFWSRGYTLFHSGEAEFYSLIAEFAEGNFSILFNKTQPILIYFVGTLQVVFSSLSGFNISITLMRILIGLPLNIICLYIIYKAASKLFKQNRLIIFTIASLLFIFSYPITLYSNLIRPDIFILTLYGAFLLNFVVRARYEYIFSTLIIGVALAFKGNAMLLIVIHLSFILHDFLKNSPSWKKFFKTALLATLSCFLAYFIFWSITPAFQVDGLLSPLRTFLRGLEHFDTGHYGLFPTNLSLSEILINRAWNLLWFFSPLIFIVFVFPIYLIAKGLMRGYSKCREAILKNSGKILVIFWTFVFWVYIADKPIQFYRYYFPMSVAAFLVIAFVLSKARKVVIFTVMGIYIIFNMFFVYYELNNTRFDAEVVSQIKNGVYTDAYTKSWMLPADTKILGKIENISELPTGSQLLIAGQNKFKFDQYLSKKDKFNESDWFGMSKESIEAQQNFYLSLDNLTLYYATEKGFLKLNKYLPYDIWYMTHSNFYIYTK